MFRWVKEKIRVYKTGRRWQHRANEMYLELAKRSVGWGCEDRCTQLIKEMKAEGLKAGFDYIAEHGEVTRMNRKGKVVTDKHVRLWVYTFLVDPTTCNTYLRGFKSKIKGEFKRRSR